VALDDQRDGQTVVRRVGAGPGNLLSLAYCAAERCPGLAGSWRRGYRSFMGAGLLWTVIGSAAGVLGAVLVAWQVHLQLMEHREVRRSRGGEGKPSDRELGGLPVAAPFGRLPAEIRGRAVLLGELRRPLVRGPLARQPRRPGGTWVLAGMGGLGKSTMALAAAQTAGARGWRVWWVTATDTAALTGGMLEILRQLGAPETVTQPVREGDPVAAERAWEYLNGRHLAGRRWLLIFDNADNPAVLAAPGTTRPGDHTGWLRPDPSGMVIITSRNQDARTWGPGIALRMLAPLGENDAAMILTDLAPGVSDEDGRQARELGRRLGGLPLALHLAGSYLASPFARWHTFADYHRALDSVELPAALADLDEPGADDRATIQRTWDLSLDALADSGIPQARQLLFLLSCYAPATPIPPDLLQPQPLTDLLAAAGPLAGDGGDGQTERERQLRSTLRSLARVGLLNIADADARGGAQAITVHPVVADVNRARLRTAAPPALPGIGEAAVRQMRAATRELGPGRPADWVAWQRLVPHILALLEWLAAHLSTDTVADLLNVSSQASDALVRSGNAAAAEKLARAAVAASPDGDHPAALAARYCLAAALEGQGRNNDAEQVLGEVLARQQRVLGDDHPDTLTTRWGLARAVSHTRYGQAEPLYREVLADQRRVLGDNDPRILLTRHALARTIGRQGRADEAEQMYRQVLDSRREVLGDDHPDTLITRHALAWSIGWQGRYSEAEQQFLTVLADQQRILGDAHPHVLSTRHDLAWSIAKQGRNHEAERHYREVLDDQRKVMGDDHPHTLYTRLNLAAAIAGQGRHREAEHRYRQLIIDEHRSIGDEHPITLETTQELARVIGAQGRPGEAEQLYRQALAGHQHVLGEHHPSTLTTGHLLALAIAEQGRHAEAEQLLNSVLSGREQALGKGHPDTQATRQELKRITHRQGLTTS
jgi:tetratricopeptide (TPR) repeat protein